MASEPSAEVRTHDLKTWPAYFAAVADGRKTFELRRDDRGYAVGDTLLLREWEPDAERYTGREERRRVTYVVRDAPWFGLVPGFCILGLDTDAAEARGEARGRAEERKRLPIEVAAILALYECDGDEFDAWTCGKCGGEYLRDIITACPKCSSRARAILNGAHTPERGDGEGG